MAIGSPEFLVIGAIHGLIGVSWMGVHVGNEIFLMPDMRKAKKLADMPALRTAVPRASKAGAALGLLTLISGLIFFFAKWGLDTGSWFNDPEARTVLIALGAVLLTIVVGFGVLKPGGEAFGKKAAGFDPMAPLPDDFKADLHRLEKFLHISSALVTTAFILMIVALNGGI